MNCGAMKNAIKKQQRQKSSNGFAIPLTDTTDLGLPMVIPEPEDGQYEPGGVVASISEAREIAESDLQGRMRRLERGGDPGLCPYASKVWATGVDGDYRLATELPATSMPADR